MQCQEEEHDSGFTLIELLIVIVILGVLAGVVVFAVGGITDRGTASAESADERTLETAEETHWALFGTYADEPGLVAAGLLHDESDLFDIALAGDDYTLWPNGSAPATTVAASPTPTTAAPGPPAPPVAITYLGSYSAQSVGIGTRTLAIIGTGSGTGSLWTTMQTTPPIDTQIIWINGPELTTSADVDAIFASADYVIASVAVSISTPDGPGFVGSYMDTTYPNLNNPPERFWWSFGQGRNPTVAELEAILP